MKAIFFFFWNLMKVLTQTNIKQTDKGTGPLGQIYSFEAHLIRKQTLSPLPNRQKQHYKTLQSVIPLQTSPRDNPRTDWQIWCENNRMLFQSSA